MSGGLLPLFTNVNPTPLWDDTTGVVSTFATASIGSLSASTASISSLAVSSMTAGYAAINSLDTAISQSALFYTSSLSQALPGNASTLMFSATGPGMYIVNASVFTSPTASAPEGGVYLVSRNPTSGNFAAVTIASDNVTSIYDIAPYANGATSVDFYFANNAAPTLSYLGSFSRIGF